MRAMTGSRLAGILSTVAVFLLPVLGAGTALAVDVGETMNFVIPDLSEFPEPEESHQFTCVAVTDHAYWMVQDTCSITYDATFGTLLWGNWITQAEIDSLTANFEAGGEFEVYNTVTQALVTPADTDGDPKLYILFATVPDKYQDNNAPRRDILAYIDPRDLTSDGGLNSHDIIYINAHAYYQSQPVARQLRQFNIANGLGMLCRLSNRLDEDPLNYRALGQVAIFECFGLAQTSPGNLGLYKHLTEFEKTPYIDLSFWGSGSYKFDFGQNLGQSFLWLMYLEQRQGAGTIQAIAQSDTTGMLAMARAIDPSVPDSLAIETNLIPLYNDWLVCNVVNHLRSDYGGGIYRYDFLEGSTYQFSHANQGVAFAEDFSTYPFGFWVASDNPALFQVLPTQAWSALYVDFLPGYEATPDVMFNGQFNDGTGSGSLADAKWTVILVSLDPSDNIVQVQQASLNDFYNGSFTLAGGGENYIAITGNNPGGTPNLLWALSQDESEASVLLAAFQNLADPQYIHLFTTLVDDATGYAEGYDWFGPVLDISHLNQAGEPDSTITYTLSSLGEPVWMKDFSAWTSGNFEITAWGFDSSGVEESATRELAVGYAEGAGMALEVSNARLDVPAGAAAPGQTVCLMQTDLLGLSIASSLPIDAVVPAMSGIAEGPVSISDVCGTISFPASDRDGAVYRWNGEGWTQMDSYWQSGRMCAAVSEGGIYVYGTAPGVSSPALPAVLTLAGNAPNPFSAETVISFSMPSAGRATLRVFDMAGRVVRTLADDDLPAASHTVVWDGRDDSGNTVGAGIYFCRLEASGRSAVQKMIRVAE